MSKINCLFCGVKSDFPWPGILLCILPMLTGFADNGGVAKPDLAIAESAFSGAITAACEQQVAAPKVEVELQEATVVESQQYNIVELSELSKSFVNTHFDEGKVLGLTHFEYTYTLSLSYPVLVSAASDITCTRPHFKFRVSGDEHQVNIAKDYQPKSCEFNVVRRHEYRHVAINEQFLRQFVKTLSAEFQSKFGGEIYYGTTENIKKNIRIDHDKKWQPFVSAMLERQISIANQQHEQVDTLEEYQKFNYVCANKYRYLPDE